MKAFTSIESIQIVYRELKKRLSYRGRNENGEVIYSTELPTLPVVSYVGSVKIHGTNASVVYRDGKIVPQSRSRELTLQSDNAGFAAFVLKHRESWETILSSIKEQYNCNEVVVYGEWCGPGIQKGVGISSIPEKVFVLFSVKIIKESSVSEDDDANDDERSSFYVELENDLLSLFAGNIQNVYSILDFPLYRMEIDFKNPDPSILEIEKLTEAVEQDCPVARHFNSPGLGEGIVWRPSDPQYNTTKMWFKSKGDKHKEVVHVNKEKKSLIDMDKMNSSNEFANSFVTEPRLMKGIDYLRENNISVDNQAIGEFLKWIQADVMKEGEAYILDNNLEVKSSMNAVNKLAVSWFKNFTANLSNVG